MAARKLVVYKEFTAQLVQFEEDYGSLVVDCSSPKGMTAAKASRKEVRDTRSNLEDLRKETKAPVLAKGTQIDDEAKAIKVRLDVLFTKFDTSIKAIENKTEIEKQEKLDAALAKVRELEEREAAIVAKEIELGIRKPATDDGDDAGDSNDSDDSDSSSVADSTDSLEHASTICEPHIKAAAERLAVIKKIRSLIEPTDEQDLDKDIDDDIALDHDSILKQVWELVDEFQ